jgi:hypothetical protein
MGDLATNVFVNVLGNFSSPEEEYQFKFFTLKLHSLMNRAVLCQLLKEKTYEPWEKLS